MNKEDEYRDQAESLRQRVRELNNSLESDENLNQLPPREQLHRHKKNKVKWKVKYPVIRLLVLFFFLLPVIIFSVIFYRDGHKIPNTEKTSGDHVGYETVNLESTNKKEKKVKNQKQTENITPNIENKSSESPPETVTPNTSESTGQSSNQSQSSSYSGGSDKNSTPQQAVTKPQQNTVQQSQSTKMIYHTVKAKETLYGVAMKYYQSQTGMDIIRKANQLQGDQLQEGQVLKIPLTQ